VKRYIPVRKRRRDQIIRERIHDPYKAMQKMHEPTHCPQCGAVFHEGRWQWAKVKPEGAATALCQACHRMNDRYPAGELLLTGRYLASHKDEIVKLARHHETRENAEHPLNRIMSIDENKAGVRITTTDIHLPHRIAHALTKAFHGTADFHYDEQGYFSRATWHRDDDD
jgi:NMD protein affecting ribosome stability and mRNA decay